MGGVLRGRVTWEDLSMKECFMGEVNFHEGTLNFPALLKKQSEIKL